MEVLHVFGGSFRVHPVRPAALVSSEAPRAFRGDAAPDFVFGALGRLGAEMLPLLEFLQARRVRSSGISELGAGGLGAGLCGAVVGNPLFMTWCFVGSQCLSCFLFFAKRACIKCKVAFLAQVVFVLTRTLWNPPPMCPLGPEPAFPCCRGTRSRGLVGQELVGFSGRFLDGAQWHALA